MTFGDLSRIAGTILLSLGGGAAIVAALARWMAGIWAGRILEQERATQVRETELLVRRRDVYSALATTLRVFLKTYDNDSEGLRSRFLEAYDRASVWAPDSVMDVVGDLLDKIAENTSRPGTVSQGTLKEIYGNCISAMRKDSGFPATKYKYRVVNF
jgi:hypothetical protein